MSQQWSVGYKIVIDQDGALSGFFIKVLYPSRSCSVSRLSSDIPGTYKILEIDNARDLARGEFQSMLLLSKIVPNNISPPIAWGTFDTDPTRSFFLTKFRELDEVHPANEDLIEIVHTIHKAESPTGMYGFHVPTFYGCRRVDNTWCDTWEDFFTREFKSSLAHAQTALSQDDELEALAQKLIDIVIPRLLRPLETGGRKIMPVLVRLALTPMRYQHLD